MTVDLHLISFVTPYAEIIDGGFYVWKTLDLLNKNENRKSGNAKCFDSIDEFCYERLPNFKIS